MVLLREDSNLLVHTVFLDPEGWLVVQDVMHISKQSFRVVAVYFNESITFDRVDHHYKEGSEGCWFGPWLS